MAPREMRRAWMTAFGNAKLDKRDHIVARDLPDPSAAQVDDRVRAVAAAADSRPQQRKRGEQVGTRLRHGSAKL